MEEKEMSPLLRSLLVWSSLETSLRVGMAQLIPLRTALLFMLLVCLS